MVVGDGRSVVVGVGVGVGAGAIVAVVVAGVPPKYHAPVITPSPPK